jgi:ribosomal protein S18 acetylase RimI-like enzyme
MTAPSHVFPSDIEMDREVKTLLERTYSQVGWKYEFERSVSKSEFVSATIQSLGEAGGQRVEYWLNRRLSAIVYLRRSQWDTDHFGIAIGKLEGWAVDAFADFETRVQFLEKIKKAAADAAIKLLFARVPLADVCSILAFEKVGGSLTDVLLTFNCQLSKEREKSFISPTVGAATQRDMATVESIAREVFTIDHFHADQSLDAKKSSEVFSKWVSNAFASCPESLLVARKREVPVGFIICKVHKILPNYDVGVIDLVGVDPQTRGQNVGTALVMHALHWFRPGVKSVYVGTQAANLRALRLYDKCNFRHVFAEATFHLHI